MKIIQKEVYVSDDGTECLDIEEAKRLDRLHKLAAVVDEFYHSDMTRDEIAQSLLEQWNALYEALA